MTKRELQQMTALAEGMPRTSAADLKREQTAVDVARAMNCRVRSASPSCIDLELRTLAGGSVSVVASLVRREFGGNGFNPNGWTREHFTTASAAMSTLLCVVDAIWTACEVQP